MPSLRLAGAVLPLALSTSMAWTGTTSLLRRVLDVYFRPFYPKLGDIAWLSWGLCLHGIFTKYGYCNWGILQGYEYLLKKYRVIQNDCRGAIDQRQFLTKFGKQPPSDNSIRRWYNNNNNNNNSCNPVFRRVTVCFRNISINTMHKGDDNDDNNKK